MNIYLPMKFTFALQISQDFKEKMKFGSIHFEKFPNILKISVINQRKQETREKLENGKWWK